MAKILTVDDSTSLRTMVAATLASAGHEVAQAGSGAEALVLLQKATFALVISDLNMPEMDGLTLIRHLRKLPNYRMTPVLVLTTEMDPNKKKDAKDAGATGWILKPFEPTSLLATIRKVLD
jgi:two-component system chemotaxis response regulator CheY